MRHTRNFLVLQLKDDEQFLYVSADIQSAVDLGLEAESQ